MKKLKICVLIGGQSSEHEISVLSGQQVVKNLSSKRYKILPVVISKKGKWQLTNVKEVLNLQNPIVNKGTDKEIILNKKKQINIFQQINKEKVDVFFIAMHGYFGEDGTIQGLLELTGIPYTGSGVLASSLGMDKMQFRKIMISENIPIPKYHVFYKRDNLKITKDLNEFPYFIKPNNQGSSIGTSIAVNKKQFLCSLKSAFEFSDIVLVDKYIKGREFTCGILGNEKLVTLPIVEIIPNEGEFFNYISKYSESGSKEIIPARINNKLKNIIENLAIKVYKAIGCKGFGRVDFLVDSKGNVYVLEVNTIPGLTPMSLFPKSALAFGLTYSKLLDRIIKYAIENNR